MNITPEHPSHPDHTLWREESGRLKRELRIKTVGYILTALGLVVGLAWNDAIATAIQILFPQGKESLAAKFVYAGAITIIVVVLSSYLTRALQDPAKDTAERK